MATMLASTPAGDPDRLTVQLPPASLDATARLIGDYAARWGFPADAVTDWRTSAAQRASGDYYDTRVFTPPDIGYVHLEFQVSHHVPERVFVVAALFSWPGPHPPREDAPVLPGPETGHAAACGSW
jgi:hypothetical protein